jgi:hypothetical protein
VPQPSRQWCRCLSVPVIRVHLDPPQQESALRAPLADYHLLERRALSPDERHCTRLLADVSLRQLAGLGILAAVGLAFAEWCTVATLIGRVILLWRTACVAFLTLMYDRQDRLTSQTLDEHATHDMLLGERLVRVMEVIGNVL